jgi:hypothetical protein
MQLKINGGKGGKDRYVPISPRLFNASKKRPPDAPLHGMNDTDLGRMKLFRASRPTHSKSSSYPQ